MPAFDTPPSLYWQTLHACQHTSLQRLGPEAFRSFFKEVHAYLFLSDRFMKPILQKMFITFPLWNFNLKDKRTLCLESSTVPPMMGIGIVSTLHVDSTMFVVMDDYDYIGVVRGIWMNPYDKETEALMVWAAKARYFWSERNPLNLAINDSESKLCMLALFAGLTRQERMFCQLIQYVHFECLDWLWIYLGVGVRWQLIQYEIRGDRCIPLTPLPLGCEPYRDRIDQLCRFSNTDFNTWS
jgi:hypothetical protein